MKPGVAGKIAVSSTDSDIDPVGACVGIKGNRVQSVVQELKGEKIDIIPWHVDPAKFVCNALAPARYSRVIIDEDNHSMEVVVPDDSLSIAIGKNGQNVRLASKLTGWHLDVKSETNYNESMKQGYDSLMNLPESTKHWRICCLKKDLFSADDLSRVTTSELMDATGIAEAEAIKIIELATTAVAETKNAAESEEEEDDEAEIENDNNENDNNPDASSETE